MLKHIWIICAMVLLAGCASHDPMPVDEQYKLPAHSKPLTSIKIRGVKL